MSRQTCYFFGTFNPIHSGHLLMAKQALAFFGERLGFDTITFVPAGNPPHRQGERGLLHARQRLHLIEQAINGDGNLAVTPVELEMAEEGLVTYTYETLKRLGADNGVQKCIMLMGQDSFETLPDWHNGDVLLKKCTFIVLERLETRQEGQESGFSFAGQPHLMASFVDYHPLKIPPIGISATYIREVCRQSKGSPQLYKRLAGLLPEPALDYLLNNKLYTVWQ